MFKGESRGAGNTRSTPRRENGMLGKLPILSPFAYHEHKLNLKCMLDSSISIHTMAMDGIHWQIGRNCMKRKKLVERDKLIRT
ncbi:hypothetical protein [Nitrososphaera sp.]|uniref:hypothetical protein n=1 Tax=Nitrososphaera sp. TaxID=1971748 RepID=UPI0017C5A781|nr:hypothetical protein [Nitrososphaera sp.]NWG36649.1 hypothetical protein [Nitrososphaera sp.]